jgi:hypothetical protein
MSYLPFSRKQEKPAMQQGLWLKSQRLTAWDESQRRAAG